VWIWSNGVREAEMDIRDVVELQWEEMKAHYSLSLKYNDDGIIVDRFDAARLMTAFEYVFWMNHPLPFGWYIVVHNTLKEELNAKTKESSTNRCGRHYNLF
jgi:hypothetical protein